MQKLTLDTDIAQLSGVGKTREKQLNKLGIYTLRDLVTFYPRAYEKRSDTRLAAHYSTDEAHSYILTVATAPSSNMIRKGLTVTKFRAFDDSGSVEVIFFNSPYTKNVFHIGDVFRFFGKMKINKKRLQLQNPKFEPYAEGVALPDFVPIYPLTSGLSSKILGKLVHEALSEVLPQIKDPLPEKIRYEKKLTTLSSAIKAIHFPSDDNDITDALSRLAFDEFLYFALSISLSSGRRSTHRGIKFSPTSLSPLTSLLPYELTDSQKHAINDIYRDTVTAGGDGQIHPMARIIVGDVGSGKTICAISAMYIAVKSNYQCAMMVPTEILARQHYSDIQSLLGRLNISSALLIGSTTAKEKKRIYEQLADGTLDIVIGTHALISEKVEFGRLGLVITDEQHRFGVAQRAMLKDKTKNAHLLVMSATPIPRTLALAMYGDLDISKITQMPKGRQKIDTFVVNESYRQRLNTFISKQVSEGGQCYIVCPSIEREEGFKDIYLPEGVTKIASERSLNLKNATEYTEKLKSELPHLRIECLHGKMSGKEKDGIMSRFSSGEIDVLVSTTVIEVGVNVPNASLMIVENAERFGLSQLHQLRGRVGRGERKSYCILVSEDKSEKATARLDVMKNTGDGFEIAEKDLLLRGPGDFFLANSDNNLRQSGGFSFRFASLCENFDLFDSAFNTAKSIAQTDPELTFDEHKEIKRELLRTVNINSSSIS